jgi:hypothetical protein
LYNVGDRTEPCGTPACISLGVDISPSTETLNFLCERNELMRWQLHCLPKHQILFEIQYGLFLKAKFIH